MIHRETPNFKASLYAPNPKEVTYWIDLMEGPDGQVIKTFDGKEWVRVNDVLNDKQNAEIEDLKDRCTDLENNKLDISDFDEYVEKAEEIHNLIYNKADKATTLAGYGITDAYTKNETDTRINTAVANLVNQAPETLDTLDELSQALGDDPNFATTVTNLIGQKVNTSDYEADKATFATKTELATKQDTLVSGTNIKTINSQSILGSGNLELTVEGEVAEAPVDGNTYARRNSQWVSIVIPNDYITETDMNAALANYATTTQLETKQNKLTGIIDIQVVTELPATQTTNVLYIVIPNA